MNEVKSSTALIVVLPEPPTSYHDVIVYVENKEYRITDKYAYLLKCTKSGGWELWERWKNSERLIGGEFTGKSFAIEVKGSIVCGTRPQLLGSPPSSING